MPPTFTVGAGILPHTHTWTTQWRGDMCLFPKHMFMDRSCHRMCGTYVWYTCQMCHIKSLQFQSYCSLEPVYYLTHNVLMSNNSLWAILPVLDGEKPKSLYGFWLSKLEGLQLLWMWSKRAANPPLHIPRIPQTQACWMACKGMYAHTAAQNTNKIRRVIKSFTSTVDILLSHWCIKATGIQHAAAINPASAITKLACVIRNLLKQ